MEFGGGGGDGEKGDGAYNCQGQNTFWMFDSDAELTLEKFYREWRRERGKGTGKKGRGRWGRQAQKVVVLVSGIVQLQNLKLIFIVDNLFI